MKRLEQWSFYYVYVPFGRPVTRVKGVIYGHAELPDGTATTVGDVVDVLPKSREIVLEDCTAWRLGEPHPDYLDAVRGQSAETDQLLGIGQSEEATP